MNLLWEECYSIVTDCNCKNTSIHVLALIDLSQYLHEFRESSWESRCSVFPRRCRSRTPEIQRTSPQLLKLLWERGNGSLQNVLVGTCLGNVDSELSWHVSILSRWTSDCTDTWNFWHSFNGNVFKYWRWGLWINHGSAIYLDSILVPLPWVIDLGCSFGGFVSSINVKE